MVHNVLVTGATGLVGSELTNKLQTLGYHVSVLSREPAKVKRFNAFFWDIEKQEIDAQCFKGIDSVVHLAGEPIGGKWWTEKQKKLIIDSRVRSAELLFSAIKTHGPDVRNFISASAVGYYGNRGDEVLNEKSSQGNGFVAECCVKWEHAVQVGTADLGLRAAIIRLGIVLHKEKGSLPVMAKPIRLFAGSYLGDGKQWVPWIHHQDVTDIFLKAISDVELKGIFNGCAPFPVTNRFLTKEIARQLRRPALPFGIPELILKMALGEQSVLPLMSSNVSAQKILDAGYAFKYHNVSDALMEIYE
ncbi:MAG: TIGR01777 family protein [Sphingobacteriales bacterium]|nr:MAG: TIGR01777 family protein [Sphingobacteriales bacterium]